MFSPHKKVEWQPPLSSIGDRNWDVVIIGAGPAGAIAAAHLANDGHQVLLLDKDHFPRKKICGDGLLADAMKCIDAISLGDRVRRHGHVMHQVNIYSPAGIEIQLGGLFITIKRYQLDAMIAQRAVDAGAVFARGKVKRIIEEPDDTMSLTADGISSKINARITIVATGANLTILKKMGRFSVPKPTAVAIRCYVRSSAGPDNLVVSCNKGIVPGYGWIFPLGNSEYNIGFGALIEHLLRDHMNIRKMFRNFVDHFPVARKLMQHGSITQPLRGAVIRSDFNGAFPFTRGPIIMVGEAIGTTLPVTFEGIGKAMESGELAAEFVSKALNSGDLNTLKEYGQHLSNRLKPRYRAYRITQHWISKDWMLDFIFRRARKSDYFIEGLAGIVSETHSPREVFSLAGIVKSFWK
jgi:geranylgeranyl reductase family protein